MSWTCRVIDCRMRLLIESDTVSDCRFIEFVRQITPPWCVCIMYGFTMDMAALRLYKMHGSECMYV